MHVMDFIGQTNHATSVSELVTLFARSIERYGYNSFCAYTVNGLRPETPYDTPEEAHYNTEFHEYYKRHHGHKVDPVFKLLLRARSPFSWAQIRQLPLSKKQRAMMDMRERSQMLSGMSTSIHSADHETIGLSMASSHREARADLAARTELYAISNQFYLRRAQVLGLDDFNFPEISLSPREKEILLWCSHGKSNSVISTILGISEKTVEFHLSSAFRKLMVSSRTSAVLRAVNLRLIHV